MKVFYNIVKKKFYFIWLHFTDSDGGTCKYSKTSATDCTITASSYNVFKTHFPLFLSLTIDLVYYEKILLHYTAYRTPV